MAYPSFIILAATFTSDGLPSYSGCYAVKRCSALSKSGERTSATFSILLLTRCGFGVSSREDEATITPTFAARSLETEIVQSFVAEITLSRNFNKNRLVPAFDSARPSQQ